MIKYELCIIFNYSVFTITRSQMLFTLERVSYYKKIQKSNKFFYGDDFFCKCLLYLGIRYGVTGITE